jgi:hypothetical protein
VNFGLNEREDGGALPNGHAQALAMAEGAAEIAGGSIEPAFARGGVGALGIE